MSPGVHPSRDQPPTYRSPLAQGKVTGPAAAWPLLQTAAKAPAALRHLIQNGKCREGTKVP